MTASGRFVLRIPPSLHEALRAAAEQAGVSLNEYCARKVAAPGSPGAGPFGEVIERAAEQLGPRLRGVVAYGSWARGELTDASDIDVLVIVSEAVELTRGLYRDWDARPLTWEDRRVEASFAHLPEAGARITGLWAEVAIDGVVVHDPALEISRRLVTVRQRIAAGEVVRRGEPGRTYWTEAA